MELGGTWVGSLSQSPHWWRCAGWGRIQASQVCEVWLSSLPWGGRHYKKGKFLVAGRSSCRRLGRDCSLVFRDLGTANSTALWLHGPVIPPYHESLLNSGGVSKCTGAYSTVPISLITWNYAYLRLQLINERWCSWPLQSQCQQVHGIGAVLWRLEP